MHGAVIDVCGYRLRANSQIIGLKVANVEQTNRLQFCAASKVSVATRINSEEAATFGINENLPFARLYFAFIIRVLYVGAFHSQYRLHIMQPNSVLNCVLTLKAPDKTRII